MEQNNLDLFETKLDETAKAYLLETTRWTKFLSVMGFILIGFLILGALFIMASGSILSSYSSNFSGLGALGVGILYLIVAICYCYPIIALFRFSSCMKKGIHTHNQDLINEGFRYQKNMYKFMGILMIITLAFYLLLIVVGGLGFLATGR